MMDREPSDQYNREEKEQERVLIWIRYEDETGRKLKLDCCEVPAGDDFAVSAGIQEGCSCTGCRLDDEIPIPDHFIVLNDLREEHTVTFLYAPVEHLCRVIEYYLDADGAEICSASTKFLTPESDYCRVIPAVEGYTPAGYTLDNGPFMLQGGVLISNVKEDHTVIFLYNALEEQEIVMNRVAVSYQLISDGREVLEDAWYLLREGETLHIVAPVVEGFRRAGYVLNATSLSTATELTIEQVEYDQHIVFLYEYGVEGHAVQEAVAPMINISVPLETEHRKLIVTLLEAILAETAGHESRI